jgi:LacI family transcriptional regulator
VSLATASRALNGNGTRPVNAELRERVLAAAAALDYAPNAHAQALASGVASTIGLVTHDVSDPYFAAIARGAMRVAMENDSLVMLASTFRDPDRELAYVSALRAQRARAILLIGSGFRSRRYMQRMRQELQAFSATGGRVAMISQHRLPFDCVLPDNRGGAAAAARALLDLGHRRFALIKGPSMLITVTDRVEGFRAVVEAAGAQLAESQCVAAEFTEEGGYEAARTLLERGLTSTAVFCVSDVMAIGALQAFREAHLHVPDELSVIGFDDIPVVRQLTPPLSTVALPLDDMGASAVEMALAPPAARPRVRPAPAQVVLRGTTQAFNRSRNSPPRGRTL